MIEKIIKGFKLAKLDMMAFDYNKESFVTNHPKLCAGSKEELYSNSFLRLFNKIVRNGRLLYVTTPTVNTLLIYPIIFFLSHPYYYT